MKTHHSISIPEPCHKDWSQMTPKDKGRFCDSCSKTVIDFTKMKSNDIQDFIIQNQGQRICGHFKQTQLESIHLHVPIQSFSSRSFHKLFLLALLITMGTSLFSCTKTNGSKQQIDSVKIIDSISHKVIYINTLEMVCDTTSKLKRAAKTKTPKPTPTLTRTLQSKKLEYKQDTVNITTKGVMKTSNTSPSKNAVPDIEIVGDITVEPKNTIIGFIHVDTPPQFKNTPRHLSAEEKRRYFQKKVSAIISENFNINIAKALNLIGKQRIFVQFTITKNGQIEHIKTRAPHIKLEEEAQRILTLFPKFSPGKQNNIAVPVNYTLPIIFEVEDELKLVL
ncbi:MAG: energy transducer TonB [Flavobacteriaceae bacterium]|nr:energy transducer TonB [Flavobacteriaceae bacterium]